MNTALSRNPSRLAAAWHAAAGLRSLFARCFSERRKMGKDRRTLQTVPTYLLNDMGLEKMEIHTTTGDHDLWIRPRRY